MLWHYQYYPFRVIRTCFENVNNLFTYNVTILSHPIKLGGRFSQLGEKRSRVYMGMDPIWPWDGPSCAIIHEMAAPNVGKDRIGMIIESDLHSLIQIYFDRKNPTAVEIIKDRPNPLGYMEKTDTTAVRIFDPNSIVVECKKL